MKRPITIPDALMSLRPNATWILRGDGYEGLQWTDTVQAMPTEEEVQAEVDRLTAEQQAIAYRELRAAEYPPITDYLDAVVKGDQAGIQAYIDACQAVKQKYPKPN